MFELLDASSRLTGNQRKLIFAGAFGVVLEFLDYFLIGFVLTFVAKPWGLSVGQSSVILLSSGVGAMLGGVVFGRLADVIGRRKVFMTTISLFTLATGAIAFTPDSANEGWLYLTAMRFLIGFGAGGLYCVDLPLIQEFMPSRLRGRISGMVTAAVPAGFLLGSALVAYLAPSIGWRGLMGVCVALAVVALAVRAWVPESPRWLLQQGRIDEARASVAWALQTSVDRVPRQAASPVNSTAGFRDLLRYPKSLVVSLVTNLGTQTGYYGLTLWSPMLIMQALGVSPPQAAHYMIYVISAALIGRFAVSYLSEAIGRRKTGFISGGAAALALLLAAYATRDPSVAAIPAMFLGLLALAFFFGEGGFAVVGPYAAEVWPTRLKTTGMGMSYGLGGLGKVIGPAGLAFIAGASGIGGSSGSGISPQTAFVYFAVWYAISSAAFMLFGIETRGKSIEELDGALGDAGAAKPEALSKSGAT